MIRSRIVVKGTVQGVGYRPFVYRLATASRIAGWVINSTEGVVIEAEAPPEVLDQFQHDLRVSAPPRAIVERVEVTLLPLVGHRSFSIESSADNAEGLALVSPDICICDDCLRETLDPNNRRYLYPFTNCTNCGPRFTIVEGIPYDRPKTTMRAFRMCPDCQREYDDPTDRRFHAQPNACPVCGPHVWIEHCDHPLPDEPPHATAISEAQQIIREGGIVAIKGIGGFHLACNACDDKAVARLRENKRRVDKPFAVMFANPAQVSKHCLLNADERLLLESPQRPIVVLRRSPACAIARSVAPGNDTIGVMLPYTPVHHLLFSSPRSDGEVNADEPCPLVMTSGNISEEPLAFTNEEARSRLAPLCDRLLMHNRDIRTRCDDSLTRVFQGREMPIRRSRGYAPFPVTIPHLNGLQVLSVGAEQKSTVCLARDTYAFVSQHIGDLHNAETLEALGDTVANLSSLFRVSPSVVARDLHPDYLSSQFAEEYAAVRDLPVITVQHHEAHVASCAADNGVTEPVIGVAFDGTGWGLDDTIWGGEFLTGTIGDYTRRCHLVSVPMPGGEAAIRHPWRMALAYARLAFGTDYLRQVGGQFQRISPLELNLVDQMMTAGLNCPLTSSCGRLFDAAASFVGIRQSINYEGQAAIEMEMLADPTVNDSYEFAVDIHSDTWVVDTRAIIRGLVDDLRAGVRPAIMAARFHNTVAQLVADVCHLLAKETGTRVVALSGGTFQNVFLLERTVANLEKRSLVALTHHQVPPNDGGISLGQVAIAASRLSS